MSIGDYLLEIIGMKRGILASGAINYVTHVSHIASLRLKAIGVAYLGSNPEDFPSYACYQEGVSSRIPDMT